MSSAGSLGYPSDLSGEMFDDLDDDRISSEVYQTEVRLLTALVDFHTRFHGWRLFAEEHLDMTLDEFLGASQTERLPFDDSMQQYIDTYEESQQKVGEVLAERAPNTVDGLDDEIVATGELMQEYDLDDMVETDVAELADELDDSPGF